LAAQQDPVGPGKAEVGAKSFHQPGQSAYCGQAPHAPRLPFPGLLKVMIDPLQVDADQGLLLENLAIVPDVAAIADL